jgi:hypothetical protein
MGATLSELVKVNSTGNELTTEGDLRSLIASLAQTLQNATVKHADDTVCEVDFATDAMGSRGRLRFRSYRRPPAASGAE